MIYHILWRNILISKLLDIHIMPSKPFPLAHKINSQMILITKLYSSSNNAPFLNISKPEVSIILIDISIKPIFKST